MWKIELKILSFSALSSLLLHQWLINFSGQIFWSHNCALFFFFLCQRSHPIHQQILYFYFKNKYKVCPVSLFLPPAQRQHRLSENLWFFPIPSICHPARVITCHLYMKFTYPLANYFAYITLLRLHIHTQHIYSYYIHKHLKIPRI